MYIIDKASDSEEVFFPQGKAKAKAKGKDMLMIADRKVIFIVIINRFIALMMITVIFNLTMTDMGYVSINDHITRRPATTTRPSAESAPTPLAISYQSLK